MIYRIHRDKILPDYMQIFLEGGEDRSPVTSSGLGATTTPEGKKGGKIEYLREYLIRRATTRIFSRLFTENSVTDEVRGPFVLFYYNNVRQEATQEVEARLTHTKLNGKNSKTPV